MSISVSNEKQSIIVWSKSLLRPFRSSVAVNYMSRDFRLPPPSSWEPRPSGLLCSK